MRVVIQRVKEASVCVDEKLVNKIDKGLLLLVGFTHEDTENDIDYLVKKIVNLRIFNDDVGLMNLSIRDVKGSILSISQFTLYGDAKKGNRPSFVKALEYGKANEYYELFNKKLNQEIKTYSGIFGANMQINLINDGPVTIILDSKN